MSLPEPAFDGRRRRFIGAAGAFALAAAAAPGRARPQPRIIELVAKKFEFVPSELHLKQGEPVVLHISAPEVPMGFNLADFKLRVDVLPGRVSPLELTPDKAGSFTFVCDVFCGTGHEDMSGTLVVT